MSAITRVLIYLFVLSPISPSAGAAIFTLDFDNVTGSSVVANYVEKGFRLSPGCHYDTITGYLGTAAIGFDSDSCGHGAQVGGPNPHYLGPAPGGDTLYVDHGSANFSLLSLHLAIVGWRLLSSEGGFYDSNDWFEWRDANPIIFSGPEWSNLDWLLFTGAGGGAPVGFDNLTLAIPEPKSVALFVIGLIGLALIRYHKRRLA